MKKFFCLFIVTFFLISFIFNTKVYAKNASPQFYALLGEIRAQIMTNDDVLLGNTSGCQQEMVNNAMAQLLYTQGTAYLNGALLKPAATAVRVLLTAVGGGLILDAADLITLYENARHSPDGLKKFAAGLTKMLTLKGAKIVIRQGKAYFIKGEKPSLGETAKDVLFTSGGIDIAEDVALDGALDPALDVAEKLLRKLWIDQASKTKSEVEEINSESGGRCKTYMNAKWFRSGTQNQIVITFTSSCSCKGWNSSYMQDGKLILLVEVKATREEGFNPDSTAAGKVLQDLDKYLGKIPVIGGKTAFPKFVIAYHPTITYFEVGATCCGYKKMVTNVLIDDREDTGGKKPNLVTTPGTPKTPTPGKTPIKKKDPCLEGYKKASKKIEEEKKKKEKEITKAFDKAIETLKKAKQKQEEEYKKWLRKVAQAKADINIGCDTLFDEQSHQHDLLHEALQRAQDLEYRRGSCMKIKYADCSYIDKEIAENAKERADLEAKIKNLNERWKDCKNGNKKLKTKLPSWERKEHQAYQKMQEIAEQIEKLKKKKEEALRKIDKAYKQDKHLLIQAKKDCDKTGKWKDIASSLNWVKDTATVTREKEKEEKKIKVSILQVIPKSGNNPFDAIDPLEGNSTTGTTGMEGNSTTGTTGTTGTTYKGIACGFDTITIISKDATSAVVSLKDNPNLTFTFVAPSLVAGPPHPTIPAQVYEAKNVNVTSADPPNLTMDLSFPDANTVVMWAGLEGDVTTGGWLGCSGEFAK